MLNSSNDTMMNTRSGKNYSEAGSLRSASFMNGGGKDLTLDRLDRLSNGLIQQTIEANPNNVSFDTERHLEASGRFILTR